MSLVLASQSPRRKELLATLGVNFNVASADIDETVLKGEAPSDYVLRLAQEKATVIFNRLGASKNTVLGSDTSVIFQDHILGKPQDQDEFMGMMARLSGQTHQVMTSVAVISDQKISKQVVVTDVVFHSLSTSLLEKYWKTGEPCDKAGGYGIQGLGSLFVREIRGSYSAVVGLPLAETASMLLAHNISLWNESLNANDL